MPKLVSRLKTGTTVRLTPTDQARITTILAHRAQFKGQHEKSTMADLFRSLLFEEHERQALLKTGCDCIDKAGPTLALKNSKMEIAISFSGQRNRPIIQTSVLQKKRGARPTMLVATYCPFCGTKYPFRS